MDTRSSLQLTAEGAEKALRAAVAKVKELGVPMSVAIVDSGTHLLAFARTDGGKPHTVKIAIAKARAAASNRLPTGKIGSVGTQVDDFTATALMLAAGPDLYVTFPGGLPIEVNGQCAGGIGVSGGTGQQDVEIAKAGLAALGG